MNRRNFLGGMAGILAAGFAPAAIGSGVLMPARKILVPEDFPDFYTRTYKVPREPFADGHMHWWGESDSRIDSAEFWAQVRAANPAKMFAYVGDPWYLK